MKIKTKKDKQIINLFNNSNNNTNNLKISKRLIKKATRSLDLEEYSSN